MATKGKDCFSCKYDIGGGDGVCSYLGRCAANCPLKRPDGGCYCNSIENGEVCKYYKAADSTRESSVASDWRGKKGV